MVREFDVTDNILDCPYCNSRPQRLYGVENNRYWIWCNNVDCPVQPSTKPYRVRGFDVRAWNKGKFCN